MSSEVDASPCTFNHLFFASMVIDVGAMVAAACSTVLAGSFALPIEDRQKDRMAERKLNAGWCTGCSRANKKIAWLDLGCHGS